MLEDFMSMGMPIDPTVLGRVMGILCIIVVIAIIYFLEIRPSIQSRAERKKRKMQWQANEARREEERNNQIYGHCSICGGPVRNTDGYDWECHRFYAEAVCDDCKALYRHRVVQCKQYPPEIQALIDEHPEYLIVETEKFFPQYYWNKLTILDKQRYRGEIGEEGYKAEYSRIIKELKHCLEEAYAIIKAAERDAARPHYDPTEHSPY